jgi:NAD+ synthase
MDLVYIVYLKTFLNWIIFSRPYKMDNEKLHKELIEGVRDYFGKHNIKKAVVGLSGGIDSSVSSKLVADAIGKENVHGLIMPLKGLSSEENINDAKELCKWIGISHTIIDIKDYLSEFKNVEWKQNKIAEMNTASRIRAVILYNYANTHDALVIGTSNKTEILLGYFTKYGDGAVDIEVVGSLFKTDEKELAKFLEIPEKIIDKTPTAELYHGQTDENELGVSYEEIDKILKMYVDGASAQKIIEEGFEKEKVEKVFRRVETNKHKLDMPHVVKVSEK